MTLYILNCECDSTVDTEENKLLLPNAFNWESLSSAVESKSLYLLVWYGMGCVKVSSGQIE